MHSLHFTEVLDFVTSQTTSKLLGIGSEKWSRSDVKTVKYGKQASISGQSLEKRAILYTSTMLEEAQLLRNSNAPKYPDHDVFGNNDLK